MLDNTSLRVFVASGYYDVAVPFGATRYNFRHLAPGQNLDRDVQVSPLILSGSSKLRFAPLRAESAPQRAARLAAVRSAPSSRMRATPC